MSALLESALSYAAAGIAVFPVRVTRGSNGKKHVQPVNKWRDASTTSAASIAAWFEPGAPWADASLAIDCGKSGLVVVDADGAAGLAGLAKLGLPAGCVVTTPGGGQHHYYLEHSRRVVGIDSSGKVAPGVDVRGLGGFVIAPPSADWRGAYAWWDGRAGWPGPNIVVPDLIVDRMTARSAPTVDGMPVAAVPLQGEVAAVEPFDTPARRFTKEAAVQFCKPSLDELRAAPDGQINSRLNDAAKVLSHFIPAFWPEPAARGWLHNALKSTLYDGKTWRADDTISSAFRSAAIDWTAELEDDPFATGQEGGAQATSRLQLYDANALADIPPPEPLIADVLDKATVAMLAGKFGTYKTFLALSWAAHLATGADWAGHEIPAAVPVIYVYAEGVFGARSRVEAWKAGFGQIPDGRLFVVPRAVRLTDEGDMDWLGQRITETGAGLVVFDTLSRCAPGVDHDKQKDMGPVIDRATRIRDDLGCSVLLTHHTGHAGERARGSSVSEDDIDASFVVKLAGEDLEDRSVGNPRVLHHRKRKDGELIEPVGLRLVVADDHGAYVDVDPFGTVKASRTGKLAEYVERANKMGLAPEAGRDSILAAFRAMGISIGRNEARDVAAYRKGQT